jgi:hypothetical protein
MTKPPASVRATFVFMILNVLIWLTFGVITGLGAHPSIPEGAVFRWGMAVLALLTAGALLGLAIFLRRRNRIAHLLTLGLLGAISVLTITDEFGLVDLAVLVVNVVPIVLLIKDRAWYSQATPGTPVSQ